VAYSAAEVKIVVPYAPTVHPVTKFVLDSYGLPVWYAHVEGDYGYSELLAELWAKREAVVIVEQDIAPWPGCIEELRGPAETYCTCSYVYNGGVGISHMLGIAKISPALMDLLPNLWDEPCHWSQCDRRLFFAAQAMGRQPHQHRPSVIHLKGCAV
jgi:hypothetical protein